MARYTVGKYRIYSTDLLNWQIEEFTTTEHHLAKSTERWKHHERYCQKLEYAFAYVLECMLKDGDIDIETVEQFKELTEQLKADVRQAIEGVEQ